MANVIEVLLRAKDQTGPALNKFKSNINGLKAGLGAVAGVVGLGALAFAKMVQVTAAAEKSTVQLNAALKATGDNAGVTKEGLDALAESIQRTTTYDSALVKSAEAILLTFKEVRGEAFERTIQVSTDLAARLGVDLVAAVREVGRALNDPVKGLATLNRSGIQFTQAQKDIIKQLVDTGQAARAQSLILTELENRYKGSAEAARNTLSGALQGLKNSFDGLFESTKGETEGITNAINGLSEALSDPDLKDGLDTLVGGFLQLVALLPKAVSGIAAFDRQASDLVQSPAIRNFLKTIAATGGASGLLASGVLALTGRDQSRTTRNSQYGGRGQRGQNETFDSIPAIPKLEEFNVTVQRIKEDYSDVLAELEESTRTSTENQAAAFIKLKTNLEFLRDEKLITGDKFNERLGTAIDDLLPLFDLNQIRSKYKSVKQETTELGEFMKGVWQGVGRSIQSALSDAIYDGKLSIRGLVDVVRRAAADILSAFVTSGIKKYIGTLFSGTSSKSSSSSSAAAFGAGLLGALGFAASGGRQRGPRIVGEDGPELDMGSGRIYNQRQLAFGGGSGINYAPVNHFQIIEREDPEKTKREILQQVAAQGAQQQAEFARQLERNNIGPIR